MIKRIGYARTAAEAVVSSANGDVYVYVPIDDDAAGEPQCSALDTMFSVKPPHDVDLVMQAVSDHLTRRSEMKKKPCRAMSGRGVNS